MSRVEMHEAFWKGCEARRHDVPATGNPYDEGETRKFNAWISGWMTEDEFLTSVQKRSAIDATSK